MMQKFKKALITGGNSGIGFALAEKLIAKNIKVTILGRDEEKLKQAKKKLGSGTKYIVCDLSSIDNIQRIEKELIESEFDIVINNAGIIQYGLLEEHSLTRINDIININLTALIAITKIVLPGMKQRNCGVVVNVSSTSGINWRANETAYVASKWGVQGFTESLKKEIEETKLKVIGVYPGGVETPLFDKAGGKRPVGSFMKPEQIAKIISFAIFQPDVVRLDTLVINRNKYLK
ncbi:MAG: SDR family oxidoreductase [Candidatus Dojkabacteria bacterium]